MTNEIITMIVSSVVVPLLTYTVVLLRNYLIEKTKIAQVKQTIELVADAAILAVNETAQVYVDGIKGTPDWDREAQDKAFMHAYDRMRQILGEESFKILNKVTGDAETYLRTAIESTVREAK